MTAARGATWLAGRLAPVPGADHGARRAPPAQRARGRRGRSLFVMQAWLLGLALGGCAALQTPGEAPPLAGRLALTVEAHGDQPRRGASTRFELFGNAERGRLVLSTPIGGTLARASWRPGEAEVDTGQGEPQRAATLDALADRLLGQALPLAALVEWLHGRTWAGAPSTPLAGGFEQLGWRVDTTRRAEGWIEASRAAPPAITVRARLDDDA